MKVSPLIYLGVIVFIIQALAGIIRWTFPAWVSTLGMVIIALGLVHTFGMKMKEAGN